MKNTLIGLVVCSLVVLLFFTVRGCASAPGAAAVREHLSPEQLELGEPIVNSIGMVLVPIPPGDFRMGSPPSDRPEENRRKDDLQHQVTITRPFYIGCCEVTQGQFASVMDARPWEGQPLVRAAEDCAATYVNWEDAAEFCRKLSDQEGVTYRLPSEAEWEYACRAGTETAFSFGDDGEKLGEYAWFHGNSYADGRQYAQVVGQKRPNAWGLYDMHGNAWEWCGDWYAPYSADDATDPTGPEEGRHRVWRGGGFGDNHRNIGCATRNSEGRVNYRPEFVAGFRVVRVFEDSQAVEEPALEEDN